MGRGVDLKTIGPGLVRRGVGWFFGAQGPR